MKAHTQLLIKQNATNMTNSEITTSNKTKLIVKYCLVVLTISLLAKLASTTSLNEFVNNLLDWQSI